jgi:hypothetical protein
MKTDAKPFYKKPARRLAGVPPKRHGETDMGKVIRLFPTHDKPLTQRQLRKVKRWLKDRLIGRDLAVLVASLEKCYADDCIRCSPVPPRCIYPGVWQCRGCRAYFHVWDFAHSHVPDEVICIRGWDGAHTIYHRSSKDPEEHEPADFELKGSWISWILKGAGGTPSVGMYAVSGCMLGYIRARLAHDPVAPLVERYIDGRLAGGRMKHQQAPDDPGNPRGDK